MEFNIKTESLQPNLHALTVLFVDEDFLSMPLVQNWNKQTDGAFVEAVHQLKPFEKAGQTQWLNFSVEKIFTRILLVSAVQKKTDPTILEKIVQNAAKAIIQTDTAQAEIYLDCLAQIADGNDLVQKFVLALENATYQYHQCKSTATEQKFAGGITFVCAQGGEDLRRKLDSALITAGAISFAKDLGNAPGNICTPEYLAQSAAQRAKAAGAKATIYDKEAIQSLGMGAFWSVAKGSEKPPFFIELTYQGAADKDEAPVVLVGKGITFDSGGISLKPGEGMDEMKFDMCGAATVIATFCAATQLKLPLNLVALVPTCENMPSGGANKPGDIVTSMNGLTIEVLNTDAEGRLILCDALTYAEKYHPQAVIDVATLTGACIIALGHVGSAVIGNNEELIKSLLEASVKTDDKAWQLPMWAEFQEQLHSNFADIANIGGRPAGTITAACFLSRFAEKYPWAHLDIAGTAWKSGKEKGATGRPVSLLLQYLQQLSGV